MFDCYFLAPSHVPSSSAIQRESHVVTRAVRLTACDCLAAPSRGGTTWSKVAWASSAALHRQLKTNQRPLNSQQAGEVADA